MQAAIFYGGQDIRLEECPQPTPGPGEVVFRVLSAGICGSDLHLYRGQYPYGTREPHQRGHELAGEVVALGDGVTGLALGQRVGIEAKHLLGCGTCRYCCRGFYWPWPHRKPAGTRRLLQSALAVAWLICCSSSRFCRGSVCDSTNPG